MNGVTTTQITASLPDDLVCRSWRTGIGLRRRAVLLEVAGTASWCLLGFFVLADPTRRFEVALASWLLNAFGVTGVSGALGNAFVVFPATGDPFVAVLTPSCSALPSLLALSALAFVALRQRAQALVGFLAAAAWVMLANQARLIASLLAGRYLTIDTLVWFHDWIGALLNFAYTLTGLLIMIALTMHIPERAEQDRAGRHTARRPDNWARPGLGYRVETDRPSPPRMRLVALAHRYLLPDQASRALSARRESRRIDYRVGHLPAQQRAEALRLLASKGLAVHTATLVAAATNDTDELVLNALADAVAARQWEPASNRQIMALRLWARAWLMRGAGTVTLPGAAGQDQPAVLAAEQPQAPTWQPTPAPSTAEPPPPTWQPPAEPETPGQPPAPAPAPPAVPTAGHLPAEAPAPTPYGPTGRLIAVTGAGGPAGIAVIRALRSAGERVLALDADPAAAGLRLASAGAVLPHANAAGYGDALVRTVAEHRPAALVCTVAEEFQPLRLVSLRLAELGCNTWLPPPAATDTCLDKAAFAAAMLLRGVPHPPTALSAEAAVVLPGPWVVKPAAGRGSREVVFANTEVELYSALAGTVEPVVQTRMLGREFTADVLLDRDGALLTCVPRWRDATRGGISVRGTTFHSTTVTRMVTSALTAVGLTGPANVQGFVTNPEALDSDPQAAVRVTIIEVNPRFSGGLPLTLAAGADVVNTYVAGILDPNATLPKLTYQPGIRMSRYFAEVFYTADGTPVADPLAGPGPPP